jgi:hypothetical protein
MLLHCSTRCFFLLPRILGILFLLLNMPRVLNAVKPQAAIEVKWIRWIIGNCCDIELLFFSPALYYLFSSGRWKDFFRGEKAAIYSCMLAATEVQKVQQPAAKRENEISFPLALFHVTAVSYWFIPRVSLRRRTLHIRNNYTPQPSPTPAIIFASRSLLRIRITL